MTNENVHVYEVRPRKGLPSPAPMDDHPIFA